MIRYVELIFVLLVGACLAGCGNWAGNPKKPEEETGGENKSHLTLEIKGENTGASLLAESVPVYDTAGAAVGSMTLTSARVSLRRIKLIAANDSNAHDAKFDGPYIVDLLTDTTKPDIGKLAMPAGSYDTIKLQLAKLEEDEAVGVVQQTDPMIRNSIHLMGTYSGNNQTKSFSMLFDLDEEFFIPLGEGQDRVELEDGTDTKVVISFSLSTWFDFIGEDYDFSDITQSSIVLDKGSDDPEKEIRETIKDLVKDSADFSKGDD